MLPITVCVVALAAALILVIVLDRRQVDALLNELAAARSKLAEEREKSFHLNLIIQGLAHQQPLDDSLFDSWPDLPLPTKSRNCYATEGGEAD